MVSDDGSDGSGEEVLDPDEDAAVSTMSSDWYGPELQRLWFSTRALQWQSLALVPASVGVSVIELAYAFSSIGLWSRGESVEVVDLRNVLFSSLRGPIEVIKWHLRSGGRVVLALKSCFDGVATVPLAQAADCAILCVALGATRIAEANETVEQVGREHFVGTLMVRPRGQGAAGSTSNNIRRLRA
jgi:hypothetical protein